MTESAPAKLRSTAPPMHFLLAHPAHVLACGFGSGLSPVAPGTIGTLFAWASYPLLARSLSTPMLALLLFACLLLGILVCDRAGKALGVHDHGSIVWDEIVPFWWVLFLIPPTLGWQAAAFALFRLFDVTKPAPARYFDRHVPNGFGVMADDVVAAFYTLLVLALLRFAGIQL